MDENCKNTATLKNTSQTSYNYIEKEKTGDQPEIKLKPNLTAITVAPTPKETSQQFSQIVKPSLIKQGALWYEASGFNSSSDFAEPLSATSVSLKDGNSLLEETPPIPPKLYKFYEQATGSAENNNMDKNRKNTDTATESITSQNIEKKKNRDRLEMKPKPYRTTITVAPTPREASEQYSQVPKPSLIKERKKDLWYETSWLNSFSDKADLSASDANKRTITSNKESSFGLHVYSDCTKADITHLQQLCTEGKRSPSPIFAQMSEVKSLPTTEVSDVNIPDSNFYSPIPGKKGCKSKMPKLAFDDDYDGSEGYARVYTGDYKSDRTSSIQNVEVDATVTPGVEHLHIHINLHFTQEKHTPGQERTKTKQFQRNEEPVSATPMNAISIPLKGRSSPLEEAPPIPPKPGNANEQKAENSDDDLTAKAEKSSDDTSWNESYTEQGGGLNSGISLYYSRRRERKEKDYDEVSISNLLSNRTNADKDDLDDSGRKPEASKQQDCREQTEHGHHWLYYYTQIKEAEESIKNSENGSFAVIEEDPYSMPITPNTLMVVRHGLVIKIPIILHRLKQGQIRYALANSAETKLKSIRDLVNFYQKHKIPGLNISLRAVT